MSAHSLTLNGPDVVIVTGAGRGIGRETGRLLAASGSIVVAVDLLVEVMAPPLDIAAERWLGMRGDITEPTFQQAIVTEALRVVAGTQRADVGLVNCAFTEQRAPILDGTTEGWQRTMDVNFQAPVALSRTLVKAALAAEATVSIVNVTSVHANLALGEFGAYAASKAALTAFTRTASAEWGAKGVRVNALAPGFVAVERNAPVWQNPDLATGLKACNNLDRLAGPAEIAAGIIFLLSPAASFITGTVLPVDGGQTSRLLEVPRS